MASDDHTPTALVLGAGGAIGRAFVEQLAEDHAVLAVSRKADGDVRPGVRWLQADYDGAGLEDLGTRIRSHCDRLDLVISTIGVLHDAAVRPEKRLAALRRDALQHYFTVNSILPMLLLREIAPLLPRRAPAHVGLLSARVGSISDNRLGGWYGYRASKAALNMLVRTAAIELARSHPGLCLVTLHPGTVATPLSQPFTRERRDLLSPAESARHLLAVLRGLDAAASGGCFDWRGEPVPA